MKKMGNPLWDNRKFIYKIFYYISPCFLLIIFVVLWQTVAVSGKTILPTPYEVLDRLLTVWTGEIAKKPMIYHVGISVGRILTALIIAVIVGVPFGVAMGWNKTFCAIFKPLFEVIRPVPPIDIVKIS